MKLLFAKLCIAAAVAYANDESDFTSQVEPIPSDLHFTAPADPTREQFSAMFAVNNLFGQETVTASSFTTAAQKAHDLENENVWGGALTDEDSVFKQMMKTGFYDLTVIPFVLSSYKCHFVQESALKQFPPQLVGFLVASGTHVFAIREFKGAFYKIDAKDRVRKFHDVASLKKYLAEHLKSKNAIMSIVSTMSKESSSYFNDLAGLTMSPPRRAAPPSFPPPPPPMNPFESASLTTLVDENEPNPFDLFDVPVAEKTQEEPQEKKGLQGLDELIRNIHEEQKKGYNLPSDKPQTKKPIMLRAPPQPPVYQQPPRQPQYQPHYPPQQAQYAPLQQQTQAPAQQYPAY